MPRIIERRPTTLELTGQSARYFDYGECRIFKTIDAGRTHLSVSCKDRYPTWEELKEVRYQLGPKDKAMAIIFPPKKLFVNFHENTFHIWEIDDDFPAWTL